MVRITPFFCAATEMARDIIQFYMALTQNIPEHPLEHYLYNKLTCTETLATPANKINTMEVYVDDFIAATNNNTPTNITKFSRVMLHGIHSIFPPPLITHHDGGDPISEKKLKKQEGLWETKKEILGWDIDGQAYTIQLPTQKEIKLQTLITNTYRKKAVPLKTFQKL